MKFLPAGKWALLRLSVLFGALLWVSLQFHVYGLVHLLRYSPQSGDIVFQSLPKGPLVDAIESITGSPYSHCGVVMKNPQGKWVVYEAIGVVRETPLYLWVVRGRGAHLNVWRWKDIDKQDTRLLASSLGNYAGKPYDFRYAPGDDEIYCSELAFKAYRDAYGIEIGTWEKLGNLNWKPSEVFIREMEGGLLPLDRPMISPIGLTRSPLLDKVY